MRKTGTALGEGTRAPQRVGGVQSIARAFTVLEALVRGGGVMGLSQLAAESGIPLPTIHRLIRTLVDLGYVRQEPSRQYALGPRLLVLADSAGAMLSMVARPHLARLVEELNETANLAMLHGDELVYIAQIPSTQSMRMFTEPGHRVSPHTTAVGKAVLATMGDDEVRSLLARTGMPRRTEHTITKPDVLLEDLRLTRERGYARDDGENELGVSCMAVAVLGMSARMALSVSAPAARMTDKVVRRAAPRLTAAGRALATELTSPPS